MMPQPDGIMNHDTYDDSYIRGILNTVKTIAMVGASAKDNRPSYFAFKYLLERGYNMIPINPGLGGFPGDPDEAFLFWGREAASGDFDGDGHADLVVGAPMDDDGSRPAVGSVVVLYGALFADGFESVGIDFWSAVAP